MPSPVDLVELANTTAESAAETLRSAVGTVADAGNGAVQEALNLGQTTSDAVVGAGQAALQGGQAAVDSGLETGSDIFDAIAIATVGDASCSPTSFAAALIDSVGSRE